MKVTLDGIRRGHRLSAAVAWRSVWALEDRVRDRLWGRRLGFDVRTAPREAMAIVEPRSTTSAHNVSARRPRSAVLGVVAGSDVAGSRAVLAEAGRFYGLDVRQASLGGGQALIERALLERWPLVGLSLEEVKELPEGWAHALRAYLAGGGTLLVNGIVPAANRALRSIAEGLGCALPQGRRLNGLSSEVVFSANAPAFAREFAGVGVQTAEIEFVLDGSGGADVLVWVRSGESVFPAVTQCSVGTGRVVLSAGPQTVEKLADAVSSRHPLRALPAMMLLRLIYGQVAWHVPTSFANFIIDDPALRTGRLGLDYKRVVERAQEVGFHLTVATIPRELDLAEPDVVQLLRDNRHLLSACYHGSDHSGYEFYLPAARGMRYRARPLGSQTRALQVAVERGERFAERTGVALDRVMVFPHGVGSPQVFRTMQCLGFLATCNFDDRYPLGAPVPQDLDIGMWPADLAWAGFPLMWRRGLPDRTFILDLFLGRPAITFGHPKAIRADLREFAERAEEIRHIGGGSVRWSSLEDISRHSYRQRDDPDRGWLISMLSNEICIHNPDERARTYLVERPRFPVGSALVPESGRAAASGEVKVTVPAGGSHTVRLVTAGSRSLHPGRPCSLAGTGMREWSA